VKRQTGFRTYPNNSLLADIFRGNGASERIQGRKDKKQKTDTGFQTNYGRELSLCSQSISIRIVSAEAGRESQTVRPWTASSLY
jgi:hypothetical protein